jgi:hypothetical protein
MKTLILMAALLLPSTQGTSPCEAAKSKNVKEPTAAFSLKEICRLEQRMLLIRDGMSWEEALRKLGVWRKKKIHTIAHGATYYHSLGEGYTLAVPFWSEGQVKRIMLVDRGRVIKRVEWR